MNKRQKELLRMLLIDLNTFVQVQWLADELNCSEKTVRNDLNKMESLLQEYPSAELKRRRGLGVYLSISHEDRVKLFNHIYQAATIPEDNRLLDIAYQLLVTDKPLTLADLAEKHFTNRSTIKAELTTIARWLADYDLQLISKQRIGHYIKGRELNKRNALASLSELIPSKPWERQRVLHLFPRNEINMVRKLLRDMQNRYHFTMTEGEFESLQIHALIMIKRTRQRSFIFLGDSADTSSAKLETYYMTAWFLKQLEDALGLSFPNDEYVYFTWHLESCRSTYAQKKIHDHSLVGDVVQRMVSELQQMTLIHFRDDYVLINGLENHLASALHRIRHGLTIRNPMLSNIKKKYPYMFSMVVWAVEKVNDAHDLHIPEDEAAYLVLHFQAAIERMDKERLSTKRAVIVCDLGVGTSHLLQAKLEQSFRDIDILASISQVKLAEFLKKHKVDVVISTSELTGWDVPIIVVSPLLESDDMQRLERFLRAIDQTANNEEQKLTNIRSFLDPRFIYLGMHLDHRFKIVESLANDLARCGFAEQKFVHSAMLREKASATAIGGGIAIPHAEPAYVKKSVVSLAILQEPILWGNEMVSVVFLLAISKEDQAKIKPLMQAMSNMSQTPAIVEKLTDATSISDILTVFDK
ncbi:MAG TPA: BglG family transcription antiterminator [Bacillota bacterium]|nr:BglG family transcription antiterminator [Bacillota bacterium]